jgi:hypothetical protein
MTAMEKAETSSERRVLAGSCPLQDTGSRANLAKMEYVAAAYSHDVAQRGTVC